MSEINTYPHIDENLFPEVDELRIELAILGTLQHSQDIENDFKALIVKYPECLKAIPLLLGVYDEDKEKCLKDMGKNPKDNACFMRNTELFDILGKDSAINLYDYAAGVKVGMRGCKHAKV